MDWNAPTWWWIAGGLLVAGELATGTFYLLMLALGCAAAALAGHAGLGFLAQVVAAALVGGGSVLAWHGRRDRGPRPVAPEANRDINLDVGERVHVDAWNADGTARVHYRGAAWAARHVGDGPPAPGDHVILEMRHNELALRAAKGLE
jgi:membrane protein implicated in regulation of membrane protease activity